MKQASQFKVTLRFEGRSDGGLRVWSPDVPGLVLSGKDPRKVLDDVFPAVEAILSEMMNCSMRVGVLRPIKDALREPAQATPARRHAAAELLPSPEAIASRARRVELAAACG